MSIIPFGETILLGSDIGKIYLYDIDFDEKNYNINLSFNQSFEVFQKSSSKQNKINKIDFIDSDHILVSSNQNKLSILNYHTGTNIYEFYDIDGNNSTKSDFDDRTNSIICSCNSGFIKIWKYESTIFYNNNTFSNTNINFRDFNNGISKFTDNDLIKCLTSTGINNILINTHTDLLNSESKSKEIKHEVIKNKSYDYITGLISNKLNKESKTTIDHYNSNDRKEYKEAINYDTIATSNIETNLNITKENSEKDKKIQIYKTMFVKSNSFNDYNSKFSIFSKFIVPINIMINFVNDGSLKVWLNLSNINNKPDGDDDIIPYFSLYSD